MTSGTSYSPPPAFGRFRLLHQIGAGVLGPVFRTHDEQEQRLVAVKAFTLDITPERAEELSNQLQHVVDIDLEHPHIARPIATGVEDSVAYLAQQYVAGESLDAAIRQYGPAPANDAARLIGHVAEALDLAARVGVFHGALHPRDILVTPGETHVTGLGVSSALEKIGQHGPIRRPYAAPERESGQEWGAAADVFSLAVIAYEVLTGRRALPGTEQPMPGLAELQVHDSAALREILETAIDPEPERRPAHAREFADTLAAALGHGGSAHASGEKGGGSRRKTKPRAPKLPGLDDPLIPQEASPAPFSAPVVAAQPTAAAVAPPEPGAELVAPLEPSRTYDVVQDQPLDVDADLPAVPVGIRYEPVIDWDGVEAESDHGPVEAVRPEPDLVVPEPAFPLDTGPDDVPELRMRPTPLPEDLALISPAAATEPPRAESDEADASELALLFATEPERRTPEPEESAAAERRSTAPDSYVDDARDDGSAGLNLSVPRAIDPTRSGESFSRSSGRFESGQAPEGNRSYAPIAIGAAIGLLLGLLGGYEIGARWGQSSPATAVAPQATSAGEPARPAVSVPVTPLVSEPAQSVVASPLREPGATTPPAVSPAPARNAAAEPPAAVASVQDAKKIAGGTAPAKATTRPAVTEGQINVRTVPPGAEVSLDGERVGTSPRIVRKLPLGAHVVRVALSGYVAQERRVTITASRPAVPITITLRKAAAKEAVSVPARETAPEASQVSAIDFVSRPPGARVILDGKDVGVTPFTLNRVAPGRHTIALRLTGFRPWTTSITVDAGKPQRVAASLERDISR